MQHKFTFILKLLIVLFLLFYSSKTTYNLPGNLVELLDQSESAGGLKRTPMPPHGLIKMLTPPFFTTGGRVDISVSNLGVMHVTNISPTAGMFPREYVSNLAANQIFTNNAYDLNLGCILYDLRACGINNLSAVKCNPNVIDYLNAVRVDSGLPPIGIRHGTSQMPITDELINNLGRRR